MTISTALVTGGTGQGGPRPSEMRGDEAVSSWGSGVPGGTQLKLMDISRLHAADRKPVIGPAKNLRLTDADLLTRRAAQKAGQERLP